MGHTLITEKVEPEQVEAAKTEQSHFGFYPSRYGQSLEERVLSAGVARWNDEESGRYDSVNAGTAHMLKPVPEELVSDVLSEFNNTHNWSSDSPVVPIIAKSEYELKKKTISVKLDGKEWQEKLTGYSYGLLARKAVEQFPALKGMITGTQVVVPDVVESKSPYVRNYDPAAGWTVKSTVEADTSGGKAKTWYKLSLGGRNVVQQKFETQAAARAYGVELMGRDVTISSIDVTAEILREDDTALVKIRRNVKQATAKVVVEYVVMKTSTPKTEGWYVSFDVHN